MQSSNYSLKEIKTCLKKFKKLLLVVLLLFLNTKQLLMKLLFESLQTFAKQLLGLMQANNIHVRCVNPCGPVFICSGISIQRQVVLSFDKTGHAALKTWSCPIFNEQDQIFKLKIALQQADRRKLTAVLLIGFVLVPALWSKLSVAFTSSMRVKKFVLFLLKRRFNLVAKKESSMHWHDTIYRREASMFLKYGTANGGDCKKATKTVEQHILERFP